MNGVVYFILCVKKRIKHEQNVNIAFYRVMPVRSSTCLSYVPRPIMSAVLSHYKWKTAKVIPLYKKGQRNLPGNYRPISVLPAISKILERILCDQLYSYLTKYELLSNFQSGFRKFHSTATALLNCTNDRYVNLDRKMFNLVVLIDLN